jgi:purine-binding chemotaxis protein CheW
VSSFAEQLNQFFYNPDEDAGELLGLVLQNRAVAVLQSEQPAQEFVAFFLENECYAIPIQAIREVIRVLELTEIPRAPKNLLGVIKRGPEVLPVYDLKVRLKLRDQAPCLCGPDRDLTSLSRLSRILIVHEPQGDLGILVDRVLGVVRLAPSTIEPLPPGIGGGDHLLGLAHSGNDLLILLDVHRVFS